MATIETALTRLLGLQHPILLAPMGSAAGGKLAAAVTHAGGLGMLGSGYADEKAIRRELTEAGNARVGIGFILWALDKNPSALDVALDARPAAVSAVVRRSSPYTACIRRRAAGSSARFRRWNRHGRRHRPVPMVIIAQGRDAGGHRVTRGTIGPCRRSSMRSARSRSRGRRHCRWRGSPPPCRWGVRRRWARVLLLRASRRGIRP